VILLQYKFSFSICRCCLKVCKFTMTLQSASCCCRNIQGPPVTWVIRRTRFWCGGVFIHGILLVRVVIVITLATSLLYLHFLWLIHHVTDMMNWRVDQCLASVLFVAGSGTYKTWSFFCVNGLNITTPYTSYAQVDAIASFLKYSETKWPGNTPDSTQLAMTCEHVKCNNLGLWQIQATIPLSLHGHSCTTLSLRTPRLNLSLQNT
jgi:hypothetical protein